MVAADPVPPADASRARYPDATGELTRDGVRIVWDRYGTAVSGPDRPTILLAPTWSIVHSRLWKAQIPYLARHFRVVTWDGRGNGRSDRPADSVAYADQAFADDGLAVLDATGTDRAVVVGLSAGAAWTLLLAAQHPERVEGAVFIAGSLPFGRRRGDPPSESSAFETERETYEGWERYNRHSWQRDYAGFVRFFFGRCFTEPHSTKQVEDCVAWAHETDPAVLIGTHEAPRIEDRERVEALAARVRCPSLVIHGTEDEVCAFEDSVALAGLLGCELLAMEGTGHIPTAREPVRINLAIRAFAASLRPGERR